MRTHILSNKFYMIDNTAFEGDQMRHWEFETYEQAWNAVEYVNSERKLTSHPIRFRVLVGYHYEDPHLIPKGTASRYSFETTESYRLWLNQYGYHTLTREVADNANIRPF